MKQIQWNVSKLEAKQIVALAQRASKLASKRGVDYPVLEADMDLTACHLNGNPLDLEKLASADDFNFAYDVFGIRRHISRKTGELQDCFSPRCSLGPVTA